MFRTDLRRTAVQAVSVSCVIMLALFMSGTVAEAAVAASDFGDPSDAPFGARQPSVVRGGPAIQNLNTGEYFSDLQSAIDDADTANGHVLQLEDPSLVEGQVAITKSVTIQGQTGSEVFMAGVDTGSAGDDRGWFLVETGVTVTVRDLNFDGDGYRIFQAFRVKGAGSFLRCTFNDLQYNASTDYSGIGVASVGPCDVRDCDFTNIGRTGVLFFGSGSAGSEMNGCTYEGKGAGDWLDYMVEVGAGASASVVGNYATACRGVASSDGSESSGVNLNTFFGGGTDAEVYSNTVMDCTFGVQVGLSENDDSEADVNFNRFVGNEYGVGVNNTSTLDATNNWFGCNEGPDTPDCDATDGNPFVNPWLILAIDATPGSVPVSGQSDVTATLFMNSDDADTSGMGYIMDDTPMDFGATLGTVDPTSGGTSMAVVLTEFTAGGVTGQAIVDVTCDNETVSTPIEIVGRAEAIPTLGFIGLMLLILAVAAIGIWVIRR